MIHVNTVNISILRFRPKHTILLEFLDFVPVPKTSKIMRRQWCREQQWSGSETYLASSFLVSCCWWFISASLDHNNLCHEINEKTPLLRKRGGDRKSRIEIQQELTPIATILRHPNKRGLTYALWVYVRFKGWCPQPQHDWRLTGYWDYVFTLKTIPFLFEKVHSRKCPT